MKEEKDSLGNRVKTYEALAEIGFMPALPIIARIDGRSFHSFCKGMTKPYKMEMSQAMIATAKRLAFETNAVIAYTQSDEITLVYYSTSPESQIFFNARHSKMVSNLASMATMYFYQEVLKHMPELADRNPTWDCRVFSVPSTDEACNVLLWRELDATKNAISMAARAYYSDKELHGKNGNEKQEMLFQKGVNFNDYPIFFKRGTFIRRKSVSTAFTAEEMNMLPEKHEARTNPNLKIVRQIWEAEGLPQFSKITNRVDVVFSGSVPILKDV